jgi:hypothetical protein
MHLAYTDTCNCAPDRPLVDGSLPEYYEHELGALKAFAYHEVQGHKYFAVHFKRRHALALKDI